MKETLKAKLKVVIYADNTLVAETDDSKLWGEVLSNIIKLDNKNKEQV